MKSQLVQFSDGKFGVRKLSIFGYKFLSMTNSGYWYRTYIHIEDYCKTTDKEYAKYCLSSLSDFGTPIE